MSFDIFLQRFDGGEAVDGDGVAVLELLEPLTVERDESWARIVTDDGEADVYGIGDPAPGLMINHASGRQIWDVMFELARISGFVIMPVGCPTCVLAESAIAELPEELTDSVAIVRSGEDLLRAVLSAQ